ncbi:hypothetical protein, partial [Nonomuraea sp. NPDC049784]|uniref:hypothetical protein n=1 Tax=Nonomuraea sp. NPDC049784 TaxID=3154361 RepID=UPI0033E22A27
MHAHTQAPGTDTSVIRLDLSDDTAITPAATMQVSEPVAVLLQDLSEQDGQACGRHPEIVDGWTRGAWVCPVSGSGALSVVTDRGLAEQDAMAEEHEAG